MSSTASRKALAPAVDPEAFSFVVAGHTYGAHHGTNPGLYPRFLEVRLDDPPDLPVAQSFGRPVDGKHAAGSGLGFAARSQNFEGMQRRMQLAPASRIQRPRRASGRFLRPRSAST